MPPHRFGAKSAVSNASLGDKLKHSPSRLTRGRAGTTCRHISISFVYQKEKFGDFSNRTRRYASRQAPSPAFQSIAGAAYPMGSVAGLVQAIHVDAQGKRFLYGPPICERRKFPRAGCEQLLTQLLGFGGEKHDDAVDALVHLILGLVGDGIEEQKVHYV
jgi:hypothetical protein